MSLKKKILAAICGGALIAGCSDDQSDSVEACDAEELLVFPFADWQREIYENGSPERAIYCDEQRDAECELSTREEFQEVVYSAAPPVCSGSPVPGVSGGYDGWVASTEVCGPLPELGRGCCYVLQVEFGGCIDGRPFRVEGEIRTGEITNRSDWIGVADIADIDTSELSEDLRAFLAASWADSGAHEHASVASFARFMLDLMSVGAPPELIQMTARAIDDEVRHAQDCFAIASAFAGHELGPGEVDIDKSLQHAGDEAELLRAAILEGCIGETLAAGKAEWLAGRVQEPFIRRALTSIADEEADHAILAWKFVQWMLNKRPSLRSVARETFEKAWVDLESPWLTGFSDSVLIAAGYGVAHAELEDVLQRRVFHNIVVPGYESIGL